MILDTSSDGTTVEYANGLGINEKLWQRASGGSAVYYVADHLGSTRALMDAAGNVVEQQTYDSFGDNSGSGLTRYGYTGRERDSDTGLMYYRARWYDSQMGRFLSEDPIGLEGGVNLYAYVENNPVNFTDPEGLKPTFGQCLGKCISDQYGTRGLLLRGLVGAGAIPLSKKRLGVPITGPRASRYTNPISYFGFKFFPKSKLGRQTLGTNRPFGLLGRLNLVAGVGLLGYDTGSIGYCVADCVGGDGNPCP